MKVVYLAQNKTDSVFFTVKRNFESNDAAKQGRSSKSPPKNQLLDCVKTVVNDIPMMCNHVHVGKTKRCTNTGLKRQFSCIFTVMSAPVCFHSLF